MNFDFTISVSHIITIVGFAAAFAWNWFVLKSKTDKALDEATKAKLQADVLQLKISTLEMQLLKEYTSLSHMQSVETRLSTQIGELTSEIRELRRFLMDKKN